VRAVVQRYLSPTMEVQLQATRLVERWATRATRVSFGHYTLRSRRWLLKLQPSVSVSNDCSSKRKKRYRGDTLQRDRDPINSLREWYDHSRKTTGDQMSRMYGVYATWNPRERERVFRSCRLHGYDNRSHCDRGSHWLVERTMRRTMYVVRRWRDRWSPCSDGKHKERLKTNKISI